MKPSSTVVWRQRLLAVVPAVAVALVLAGVLVLCARGRYVSPAVIDGSLAVAAVMLAGLSRTAALVPVAIVLLGGGFCVLHGVHEVEAVAVVPYALGVFLLGELGYEAARGAALRSLVPEAQRRSYLALVGASSVVTALAVLGLSGTARFGGGVEIAGLVAALGAFGFVVRLGAGPRRALAPARVRTRQRHGGRS